MTAGSVTVRPKSGMKAEPREVGAEPRFGTGDAQIAHHRQSQAAADGGAVNGSDDRLLGAKQPVAFDIKMRGARRRSAQQRAAVAVVAAEIGAGTESFSLRREHQRAAIRVVIERFEGGSELFDQRDVEKIVRRPPDLDQGHVAGLLYADIPEGSHAIPRDCGAAMNDTPQVFAAGASFSP